MTKTRRRVGDKSKNKITEKYLFFYKNDIRCPPLLMRSHISNSFMYILFAVCNISFCTKYFYTRNQVYLTQIRPYIQSCTQKRKNILKSTPFPQEGKIPRDIFRNGGFIFLLYPSRSLCLSLRLYFCLMYVKILCFSWVVIAIYTNVYIKQRDDMEWKMLWWFYYACLCIVCSICSVRRK